MRELEKTKHDLLCLIASNIEAINNVNIFNEIRFISTYYELLVYIKRHFHELYYICEIIDVKFLRSLGESKLNEHEIYTQGNHENVNNGSKLILVDKVNFKNVSDFVEVRMYDYTNINNLQWCDHLYMYDIANIRTLSMMNGNINIGDDANVYQHV